MLKISLAHIHTESIRRHTSSFMHAHTIYRRWNEVQCVCIIGPCMSFYPHKIAFETSYYAHTHIQNGWRTQMHAAARTIWGGMSNSISSIYLCDCGGNIATSGFKITCSLFGMFGSIWAFLQYRFVLRLNSVIFLTLFSSHSLFRNHSMLSFPFSFSLYTFDAFN